MLDPILILAAEALDDLERTRIANENRLRSLRQVYGLEGSKQDAEMSGLVEGLAKLEHDAELSLKRALRRHPLGPWVKGQVGVGEKQAARLIAAIGDPYMRPELTRPDGTIEPARPRTVSELWAYCGLHVLPTGQAGPAAHTSNTGGASTPAGGDLSHSPSDTQDLGAGVAPSRARGQRSNWNAVAKSRAWLIATSCVKQASSPYRAVYDAAREKYADAVHPVDCRRCGPSGKPAHAGTPLSAGHQHARALRIVSKELLKDMWVAARDANTESSSAS